MKRYCLAVTILALGWNALEQNSALEKGVSLQTVQGTIDRVLSYPSYSGADEMILNRAGDLAARAVLREVPVVEMTSPEKERLILLALQMAFEAPQMIEDPNDRKPTEAMQVLDRLESTNHGGQTPTAIENVRHEIQHNTSTGKPSEYVTLKGETPVDWKRMEWVENVLAWTRTVKPGMTRRELLQIYTEEGGLSTRTQRTYVLKGCPIIKIDAEFAAVGAGAELGTESPDDRIVKISKPYLDYGRGD